MDIVIYKEENRFRIGHVLSINKQNQSIELEPLIREENNVWVVDMDMDSSQNINIQNIIQTVANEYGQKQDMNRIRNPHSEHAYDIWEITEQIQLNIFDGVETQ
eukprot:TRINITY_DN3176_c0_g1_i1.p4 TRINITY_DN3176_c0_g1~~TRINITY_DN3176_c0_g1_i1.p4  ORF type:complete len:104 (-),score=10.78 TRINITY_DN3176_c0_g1_i1:273-584(-)